MFRKLAYINLVLQKTLVRVLSAFVWSSKKARKDFGKRLMTSVIKNYLKRYLPAIEDIKSSEEKKSAKKIWVCWLQGEKNAPEIVKKCIESVRNHSNGYSVIVVDNSNIEQFVSLPDYIYKKLEKGYISNTHFSDILRVALLSQNGGIWIDATVFLTGNLPDEITKSPFFAWHSNSYVKNNNWLLASSPNHPLTNSIKALLLEYWKYENKTINYFFYHMFFDLMLEKKPQLLKEWEKVPVLYDTDCYDMPMITKYNSDRWLEITAKNSVHKLSYRYDKTANINGTFLEKILA
jgi:mannosyltransferase OCH1-like enzyme